MNVSVLVYSCDAYSDVWQPFFTLFFKEVGNTLYTAPHSLFATAGRIFYYVAIIHCSSFISRTSDTSFSVSSVSVVLV